MIPTKQVFTGLPTLVAKMKTKVARQNLYYFVRLVCA